ncbi:MAG: AMP-binding protein [Deltaproteobacteria bacterium]|nr:AMP-binding protein [Deltaproteobacteria bacterium]
MQHSEPKNIAELLRNRAAASGDSAGIVFKQTRSTWQEILDRAGHIARVLDERGIGRGDVVGILAPHSPAQVSALFGIALVDAAFSIINPLLRPAQMEHQIADAGMKAIVGTADHRETLAEKLAAGPTPWIEVEVDGSLGEALAGTGGEPRLAPTKNIPVDVANIIYTSGSTGRPKGVVVPHRTLLDGARIVSGYLGITEQDTTLSILPLGFDYGLNQLLTAVRTGASLVMHSHVMPLDLLRLIEREKITGLAAVPSVWPGVLAHMKRQRQPLSVPHLRYITTAGGAHPPQLLRELDDAFGDSKIIVMYGLTESFRSTYLPHDQLHERPGCVGRPVPEVEILVVDEDGNPCAPGTKGELVHRGAFVTYGYLNNPELTAKRFIELPGRGPGCLPERAVRSGDLVSMSEDGYVYFHGRMDMQIKSRGYRISPDEVAEALMKVDDVRQAAVFGLPDPALGQRIVAAYETHSGSEIPSTAFTKQLADALPSFAVPRTFLFYPALPVTANGKLDVTKVRAENAS